MVPYHESASRTKGARLWPRLRRRPAGRLLTQSHSLANQQDTHRAALAPAIQLAASTRAAAAATPETAEHGGGRCCSCPYNEQS
jgi:hypothetical protein